MKNIFYLLTLAVLFIACEGEERDITTVIEPIINPPMEEITGSVSGTVVDEAGMAVADAAVTYRNATIATDDRGRFSFSDTQLFADGTYLTVSKSGYFHGSRKFYATENDKSNIHVQLIERNLSASFTTDDGATVTAEDASVDLPSGTYLTTGGQAYNGTVNVYASYLDPSQEETFDQMPGDLTGLSTENELEGLITYGMVVVELEDASGNALQLPSGQKATLNMPVPAQLQASAPSTIPLWYFDEDNGTWIEEGEAQLVNGEYIGEVAHFTYWNCDDPFEFIELSGHLEVNREPVQNIRIKITEGSSGLCGVTYTNNNGFFTIKVPKDQNLTLELIGDCGSLGEEISLGSFSTDDYTGVISASIELAEFSLLGEILDCDGEISPYSVLEVTDELGVPTNYLPEADGSFYVDISNCGANSPDILVRAVDFFHQTASEPITLEVGGEVDLGTLNTCESSGANADFSLIYQGQDWAISSAVDSSVFATYDLNSEDLGNGLFKQIYTVTLLDWFSAKTGTGTFIFTDGDAMASYSFETPQGFDFSGTCSYGVDTRIFFIGVSEDITVTDTDLYPGNVEKVFFNFLF